MMRSLRSSSLRSSSLTSIRVLAAIDSLSLLAVLATRHAVKPPPLRMAVTAAETRGSTSAMGSMVFRCQRDRYHCVAGLGQVASAQCKAKSQEDKEDGGEG